MEKWTMDETQLIRELYPVCNAKEISEKLGKSINSIRSKAHRMGLRNPCHSCDTDYFNAIDSSDKAYWVGFITADGYVVNSSEHRDYELGIELSKCDAAHLKKFLDCIHSDSEVQFRKRQNFAGYGVDKEYEECLIRIYSKKMVESLAQYGIVQNKTYSLRNTNVPQQYMWDYIRGYFDGDGSLSLSKVSTSRAVHSYPRISFVCKNKEFLLDIQSFLDKEDIHSDIYQDRTYWEMFIRRHDSVSKFLHSIYSTENSIRLDRKYEKYKAFFLN